MKGLSMGDWSLIARYLQDEASQTDFDGICDLVERNPTLREELEMLGLGLSNSAPTHHDTFNADTAFIRLNDRLKKEKLI